MDYQTIKARGEQLEVRLMGESVFEGLSGKDTGYKPKSEFSDNPQIAKIQEQYNHYCIQSKANLTIDRVQKNWQTSIVTAIKEHVYKYLAKEENRKNKAMKYLYELDDINLLTQQISMLTLHAKYKDVEDIENISIEELTASIDPENVSTALSIYTFFTILANDNYSSDDYNQLFIESWFNYYQNWESRQIIFKMRGNGWKSDFAGVLLDN